jgi:hypothetical protein
VATGEPGSVSVKFNLAIAAALGRRVVSYEWMRGQHRLDHTAQEKRSEKSNGSSFFI